MLKIETETASASVFQHTTPESYSVHWRYRQSGVGGVMNGVSKVGASEKLDTLFSERDLKLMRELLGAQDDA